MKNKDVIILVTNDIHQDKRMQKIAKVWSELGYSVSIWGRKLDIETLPELDNVKCSYLNLSFKKGILFYLNYAIVALFRLFKTQPSIVYCVDPDTLIPGIIYKTIKRKNMVFDSHELFHEVPELKNSKLKKTIWKLITKWGAKHADLRLTVGHSISKELKSLYNVQFHSVKNILDRPISVINDNYTNKTIIYHGMLNQGRGLEQAVRMMSNLPDWQLWLIGRGDIEVDLKKLVESEGLTERVRFLGFLNTESALVYLQKATIGLNLLDSDSLSYYHSLANKTFDYMNMGVPAIHMAFPEYEEIHKEFECFLLVESLEIEDLIKLIQGLTHKQYLRLQLNNSNAAKQFTWDKEAKKLKSFILASNLE